MMVAPFFRSCYSNQPTQHEEEEENFEEHYFHEIENGHDNHDDVIKDESNNLIVGLEHVVEGSNNLTNNHHNSETTSNSNSNCSGDSDIENRAVNENHLPCNNVHADHKDDGDNDDADADDDDDSFEDLVHGNDNPLQSITTNGTARITSTTSKGIRPRPQRPYFSVGDHVYQWCSFAGIQGVYQHHGIVLDVCFDDNKDNWRWYLRIADFGNWSRTIVEETEPESENETTNTENVIRRTTRRVVEVVEGDGLTAIGSNSGEIFQMSLFGGGNGSSDGKDGRRWTQSFLRTYESTDEWFKVEYNPHKYNKRLLSKLMFHHNGTVAEVDSSPPALVRARLDFLLQNPELLPHYNVVYSNCECVAVWCKTGIWSTLQAVSWLKATSTAQTKSALRLAAISLANNQKENCDNNNSRGGAGSNEERENEGGGVPPILLPVLAAYGMAMFGAPKLVLWHAQSRWKEWTKQLNDTFWDHAAIHNPDVFVECINNWRNSAAAPSSSSTKQQRKSVTEPHFI